MNQLVDGEWRTDTYEATDEDGSFQRGETTFRNWIAGSDVPDHVDAEPDDRFQPEEDAMRPRARVGDVQVVPPRGEGGWQFTPEKAGCTPDHLRDSDYLRELYVAADPDATCRVTVPVLWDTEKETIVNNESREILRIFSTAFDGLGNDVSLLPGADDEATVADVDEVITEIYEPVNNGVYRAGFATSQAAYDEAIDDLFGALDRWNDHLADQRYLVGDSLTEADICLFTTLVRFDQVYHTHFMCNHQFIHQYDNLWPYLRDVYQTAGVAETVNMAHIKEHYYTTHPDVTPTGIIARGPDLDFEAPHDRDALDGEAPAPTADD